MNQKTEPTTVIFSSVVVDGVSVQLSLRNNKWLLTISGTIEAEQFIRTIEAAAYERGLADGAERTVGYIKRELTIAENESTHADYVIPRSVLEAARTITKRKE